MVWEVISPSRETTAVVCWMGMMCLSNYLLNNYVCAHRIVPPAALVKESPFPSDHKRLQRLITHQHTKNKWVDLFGVLTSIPLRLREHLRSRT